MIRRLIILLLIVGCGTEPEPEDCAGVAGGDAVEDCAGVCGGNTTQEVCDECPSLVFDCAGVCDGSAVVGGCDNVCGSTAVVDECGICGGDGIDTDLDGICDDIDDCIVQDGVSQECGCNTGIASGKCDCDGNVEDCNGECGGSLALDECGICGGSGASHYCWDSTWVCNESDCSEPDPAHLTANAWKNSITQGQLYASYSVSNTGDLIAYNSRLVVHIQYKCYSSSAQHYYWHYPEVTINLGTINGSGYKSGTFYEPMSCDSGEGSFVSASLSISNSIYWDD